jgi:hypothetical protein
MSEPTGTGSTVTETDTARWRARSCPGCAPATSGRCPS